MANTVIALKKSGTPGSIPPNLSNGEIAINYADGVLYYKNTGGFIASITGSGLGNYFGTVNAAGTLLIADTSNDVLDIRRGDNIIITGDAINDRMTINADLTSANAWANTKLANTSGASFSGDLYFPSGNVGLGMSSTTYRLDVIGKTRIGRDVAQGNPNATDILANAHTALSGQGGNYLSVGQYGSDKSFAQWIQSSFTNPTTATYNLILQPLGGRIGVGNNSPGYTVDVNGDVNISGTYRVNGNPISTGSGSMDYPYANAVGAAANSWSNTKLSNGTVTLAGALTTTGQIFANTQLTISPIDGGIEGGQIDILGAASYPDWSIDSYGNDLRFFTLNSGIQQITFFNAGSGSIKMGVGRGNPGYALDVVGTINATSILVNGSPLTSASMDYGYVNAVGTAANSNAGSIGTAANAYAVFYSTSVGAAVNANLSVVGTSVNAYALSVSQSVGAAVNANLSVVGTSVNAYAQALTVAGNNYANAIGVAANANLSTVGTAVNAYSVFISSSVGAAVNANLSVVGTSVNAFATGTYVKLIAGSQTITGDLAITGNLTLLGNATTIVSNNLIVGDSLIYLASNNYSGTDILDIGFVANYANGTGANVHTGLIRDATTKQYYLFNGLDIELQANNQAFTPGANGVVNAVLNADLVTSNLTLAGANALTLINNLYPFANGTANSANAYTNVVIVAGNNYSNAVGIASNSWANAVGASTNAWSNTLSTSDRAFASDAANSANIFAGAIANVKLANVAVNQPLTVSYSTSSGNTTATINLSTSGVTAATYGSGTLIPVVTIDAFGRVTSAANVSISSSGGGNPNNISNNVTTLITTGYTVASFDAGANIAAYGTWTPDPSNGNYQYVTSNGSVTVAAPSPNCAIDILWTNGMGANTVTFSGYTAPSGGGGDTYTTANAWVYILMIRKINNISTYVWKALQ